MGLTTHCFQRICGEAASEAFGLSVNRHGDVAEAWLRNSEEAWEMDGSAVKRALLRGPEFGSPHQP